MDPVDYNADYIKQISKYGFTVKLNHKYPEIRKQGMNLRWKQLWELIPVGIRYLWYCIKIWRQGRQPIMDFVNQLSDRPIYGAPIGGIGTGTIGRGFNGEFCRYSLIPGIYNYDTILTNQFIVTIRDTDGNTIYHQVLSTNDNRQSKKLSSWKWGFDGNNGNYTALYPRSWTEYNIKEPAVKLICRQISPIIPNNYKDSSLPCAVFVWEVKNLSEINLNVSITFTFQSGINNDETLDDKWTEFFEHQNDVLGVMIHQELNGMPCTYAISSRACANVDISRTLVFDPNGDGLDLWDSLERTGKLSTVTERISPTTKHHVAAGLCASMYVPSKELHEVAFSLVWDMPKINFHNKMREYLRYYTKYFYNDEQSVAPEISHYALNNFPKWESDIFKWQRTVLDDVELPDWYKSALFNELYYVADGGTVWLKTDETDIFSDNDPRKIYGRFGYLEGHEYRMYNTYDVHFYAAFALAQLWPNLQSSIQYEICDTIEMEDSTTRWSMYDGSMHLRKIKGFVPHDVGDPYEEPFMKINAYPVHDICEWKDLNLKYILTCYRDYSITGDLNCLRNFWPSIKKVLDSSLVWDKDNDGLIENAGFPDQTYDAWVMEGASSYCGSLWLASLRCAVEVGKLVGDNEQSNKYMKILERGKVSFQNKLWNGKYYNFDSSPSEYCKSIMSDQLCGQWFLQTCGFSHEVFPEDRVKSSLMTIFENNVMKYKGGYQGAVNGFLPSGSIDIRSLQSEEMWTGVSYGLAALMIHEGMIEQGFRTAEGVYRTVWEKIGMGFQTPEALYENYYYRSTGYMRPLSIWAIHRAWSMRNRSDMEKETDNVTIKDNTA
ncbi:hypothetical protein PV326_009081 [Microctonus aethiopoides]|nr:hypothetical protein PV326_009081 [Microctonus aethiopoides]